MRRITKLLTVTAVLSLGLGLLVVIAVRWSVQADQAAVPSLVISQVKITSSNGQFVTLYNNTNGTLDLNKFQLEYFNSYDLSKATSSKLIGLSGTVPPHGYYQVNDGTQLLCYQLTVESATLGLSSTAGLVELLEFNQPSPGSSVIPSLQDYIGWSKTAAAGAQTLPANTNAFLVRRPLSGANNPNVTAPGSGSWQSVQPDPANPCNLVDTDASASPAANSFGALLPATQPPVTIVSLADNQTAGAGPSLPAADVDLMAPQVTELLPNPNGTGNDATDEFVELYNPNQMPFDLSGFILQSGLTSFHKYTFPAGSSLPANGFMAFYSSVTGLSLSNSGSQVQLLDPTGTSVSTSAVYGTADDGQTWDLANGKWYWTSAATPGAANIIKQPTTSKTSSKSKKTSKAAVKSGSKSTTAGAAAAAVGMAAGAVVTPIHLWTLALVAGLALLYVGYEYRADLANYLWKLRRNLAARRGHR